MATKPDILRARLEPEIIEEAKRLADEHYDGNLSMLVRMAVKRYTTHLTRQDDQATADADQREAIPA
jgi:hypothetical protein